MLLNCKGRLLNLNTPKVMGIINVNQDSFYSQSRFTQEKAILQQAEKMLLEGASILDLGAVSSRPGAELVEEDIELKRIIPAIESIHKHFPNAILSIDSYRAKVCKLAIEAGAHLINDISAGNIDESYLDVVAQLGVPYILMHMQGIPSNMQDAPSYSAISKNLLDFFISKLQILRNKGIKDIIIDPGFGFGKTIKHNYQILKNLHQFKFLDLPILVGVSRKSMIWKLLENNPQEALNGTTALHMLALQQSANILRVHDVKEAVECIKLHNYLTEL